MNLPTTTTGNEDYSQPLTLLFMAYETKNETREAGQLKAAAYKEAMKGLPYWCVEQAVHRFNSGQIDRKNSDFRPSPEAVAKEARRLLDDEKKKRIMIERERRAKREADMVAQQEKARAEYLASPEGRAERERIAAKLNHLRQSLQAASAAMSMSAPFDDSALRPYKGKIAPIRTQNGVRLTARPSPRLGNGSDEIFARCPWPQEDAPEGVSDV